MKGEERGRGRKRKGRGGREEGKRREGKEAEEGRGSVSLEEHAPTKREKVRKTRSEGEKKGGRRRKEEEGKRQEGGSRGREMSIFFDTSQKNIPMKSAMQRRGEGGSRVGREETTAKGREGKYCEKAKQREMRSERKWKEIRSEEKRNEEHRRGKEARS